MTPAGKQGLLGPGWAQVKGFGGADGPGGGTVFAPPASACPSTRVRAGGGQHCKQMTPAGEQTDFARSLTDKGWQLHCG